MADRDPTFPMQPSPFEIDRRLRSRVTEAVIAQGGFRHDALNGFLRERLSGRDITRGALFADPAVEGASGYISSGIKPEALAGNLLHPNLVEALTWGEPGDDYRFDHPAYAHQLEAWRLLTGERRDSVLVSSGTGSGKTECFLVPLLDDLAREAERDGALSGVRAIMLYPLNALIASQQERLRRWTQPFAGRIRFALYNGQMADKRKSARDRAEEEVPEQVLYRTTLRTNPPPILVTNNTMLEYMTIRKEDQPIVDASRGKLRWIIIDEAHSYVGSAAAEISLLLRRVLETFGVEAKDVRFVATSATIGGAGDEARADLQRYLADLAGVAMDRVHVVLGGREKVILPPPDAPHMLQPLLADLPALSRQPLVQHIVRAAESTGIALTKVEQSSASGGVAASDLLEAIAGRRGGTSILPLRVHNFVRSVPGLWSCLNPGCSGARPEGWPFGMVHFELQTVCFDCRAPVFEIIGCRECGEPWLNAFEHGDRLLPGESPSDEDEFTQASDREDEGAEEAAEADEERADTAIPGTRRLIATRVLAKIRDHAVDLTTGVLPERRSAGTPIGISDELHSPACPHCHAAPSDTRTSPLRSFRFGAPFLIQNAAPTMLEGVSPAQVRTVETPAEGRQLLSFTDSRQGTARFAASIETMSERGAVRALVYHMVQRRAASADIVPEERAILEATVSKLTELAKSEPLLQPSLDAARAKLDGASAAEPITWHEAVRAIADEPLVTEWISNVWDLDRDERYHTQPKALANFLLLRELARRPRRANALETLGFAQLTFDRIEKLAESSLPDAFRRKNRTIEEWRAFLYYMLDSPLRAYFVLQIDREDARWLLPKRAFLRNIVGPDEEKRKESDLRWPRARTGSKSNAVLALERGLDLDSNDAADRGEINEVLESAWRAVRPLLEGDGSTYALDIGRARIAPVRDAWLCPITHRVLPRLLFGRSQYGVDRRALNADVAPQPIVLPRLPVTLPRTEKERAELTHFVESDPEIAALRIRGAWGDLHDRAAAFAPYIRVEEHSAQQPPHRLREFEREFKAGRINMLTCSTTMEMGVDIGSVEAVLNTNVPPSIANYRQRVGRAGRRGQCFSFSLTLARDTPLDRETFRDPVHYLNRGLRAPKVTMDSARIVQRHVNALLLAAWLRAAEGQLTRIKVGDFYGFPQGLSMPADEDPPAAQFVAWLREPSTAGAMMPAVKRLVAGTALALDSTVLETAAQMFERARDSFGRQWQRLGEQLVDLAPEARKSIEIRAKRMTGEPLLKELANASLLPGHGFPNAVLLFDNSCRETQDRRHASITDEDKEVGRNTRYEYPSRTTDIAIREYAPGAEVVIDGLVWTSAGVTLNWKRPASDASAREIQSIRTVWSCRDCHETGCSHSSELDCPACGSPAVDNADFLDPSGFRVDWYAKPHAETDQVHYIEPVAPRISARRAAWEPLPNPALGRIRSASDGLVFHSSRGEEKLGYQICLDCGRAAEPSSNGLNQHQPLTPLKGHKGPCTGNEKTYAITAPIALGHEVLTDVLEFQPVGLDDHGAAWALGSALREALSRRLGIEPRELGLSIDRRAAPLCQDTLSIFLFDQSAGGAGYAPRLADEIGEYLLEARRILDCTAACERACSACVLTNDLHAQQKIIDRIPALALVEELLKGLAGPEPSDIALPGALLAPPAADAIARRLRQGDVAALFFKDIGDLGALTEPPFVSLFAAAEKVGARIRLVLPPAVAESLDEAFRRGLRNASHRHGFTLWIGRAAAAPNGAALIAALEGATATGFFTRDSGAQQLGPDWGKGRDCPVVAATLASLPAMEPIAEDSLERQLRAGDRVKIISGDPGRAIRLFGGGFVSRLLQGELEAANLWKPGELISIEYSDRYLKAPLPVLLMIQTVAALRDALVAKGAPLALSVRTEQLRPERDHRPAIRLNDNWQDANDRADVVEGLAAALNFTCSYDDSGSAHGRKLKLCYRDGSQAIVLFDQGFGYWRSQSNDRHNFRASPQQQIKDMLASGAFVAGNGESYIAVGRSG
ncbi:DEAD/DEAH box helicase [Sphingomonas sp. RT2P30]|uniref:DEAD/DEAH box helicase n=1 Tax=Parasphingomonas halimpatiens TaxID=3096162 RepID=UPI002FC7456B